MADFKKGGGFSLELTLVVGESLSNKPQTRLA